MPQQRRGLKKYGLRRCLACKQTFPLDNENFYRNNSKGASGLDWFCKSCHRDKNKKYYRCARLKDRFAFLQKHGFACHYCGRRAPEVAFHIDHVFPLSLGGTSNEENLTLACDECNIGKGNKPLRI